MAKYTHYITVPMTTSVNVIVESDDDVRDVEHAYDMAMKVIEKANTRFELKNKHESQDLVELGEAIEFHEYLNRGNVCYASCAEIEWYSEGGEDGNEGGA